MGERSDHLFEQTLQMKLDFGIKKIYVYGLITKKALSNSIFPFTIAIVAN